MQCITGNYYEVFILLGHIQSPLFGWNILEIVNRWCRSLIALQQCNIVNLLAKQSLFPDQYKIEKLKSLFKKALRLTDKITGHTHS